MRYASREWEQEMLATLREYGMVADEQIVDGLLNYFSSDDTCAALKDLCEQYDLPTGEDDEDDNY